MNAPSFGAREPAPLLQIENLRARRGDRHVLSGVTLAVRRGEIFGILGPNGAGKSTLFGILTGLLEADSGTIRLDGRPLRASGQEFRERVGVVFQEPALDARLTLRENLALAAALYGVPRADARRRVESLAIGAGLADRLDEPVATLSGGMRRRAEIARALVHEPEILLLDEPTTGLDEGAFRKTWDQLAELRQARGLSLLLTTHRPDEAERADRLAILDAGRIVACDTPTGLRALVRGDVIVLEADDPHAVAEALRGKLGLAAKILDGRVLLEEEGGHAWIPRIVEALGEGALRSVSLRRPGLGDAFLELTGRPFAEDAPVETRR